MLEFGSTPIEAPAFQARRPGRRLGLVRTAVAGLALAVAAACTPGAESAPDKSGFKAGWVQGGTVLVKPSEINLRKQPRVYGEYPPVNLDAPTYQDSVIDWEKVKRIEDEDYDGMSNFRIDNSVMVKGADPLYDNGQGNWVALHITMIGTFGDVETQAFLFKGPETRKGLVTLKDGPSLLAVNLPDGNILGKMADGRTVATNIVNVLPTSQGTR